MGPKALKFLKLKKKPPFYFFFNVLLVSLALALLLLLSYLQRLAVNKRGVTRAFRILFKKDGCTGRNYRKSMQRLLSHRLYYLEAIFHINLPFFINRYTERNRH
jgi:hypothetical protein